MVSKAAEADTVGRGALKAATHSFKEGDGFSKECKNDCELEVSKGKPPLSLCLFFCEVIGSYFHCVCLGWEAMPKIAPRKVRVRWRP